MLTSFSVAGLVGLGLGFLAGLGVGGGSLLILWLTMVLQMPYPQARTINLLFFLAAAGGSALLRWKHHTRLWKKILPAVAAGCAAAAATSFLGRNMDLAILKKLFGFLLILTALRELGWKPKK